MIDSEKIAELEREFKDLEIQINQCVLGCGLDPYKNEMKERCKVFTEKIQNNKEISLEQKHEVLYKLQTTENALNEKIEDVESRCDSKIVSNRKLIGKLIGTAVVLFICAVGVISTIQTNKVSQYEYNNHLQSYQLDKTKSNEDFRDFLRTYQESREKRDNKIDRILEKLVESNSLMQQQLEVIKVRIENK